MFMQNLKSIIASVSIIAATVSASSVYAAQVQSATASGPQVGRYLGTALYNGTNTECTMFANPVMAVGPVYGLVNVGGLLYSAWYYNCHEYVVAPTPIPTYNTKRLFDENGPASCPIPQRNIGCPAVISPIVEQCEAVGGTAYACPGSCTTLCNVSLSWTAVLQ
jgi:hypothetical protein